MRQRRDSHVNDMPLHGDLILRVDWQCIENRLRYRIHKRTPWCWACANAVIASMNDHREPVPHKRGWFFRAEHRCAAAARSLK